MRLRRIPTVLGLLFGACILLAAAHSGAQTNAERFIPDRQIGAVRPAGIQYDPNFDRFAWVDDLGRLLIVDAATYTPIRTLYDTGSYNGYSFSRNGRLFAVAIGRRVDVWDIESGSVIAQIEPQGANSVQGPFYFSLDDEFLLFDSITPAPQELRRSENDTRILPWIWDVAAAADFRPSKLPNRVLAFPYFATFTSMAAGDNGIVVQGLDSRIQIMDADTPDMTVIADIIAERDEPDPLTIWRSANDELLYVNLNRFGDILQVDTITNATYTISLGRDLTYANLDDVLGLRRARASQVIGESSSLIETALGAVLYEQGYLARLGYPNVTIILLDVLMPLTPSAGSPGLLVYAFNEARNFGSIDLIQPQAFSQIVLSPDGHTLMLRRDRSIELYDIASGALVRVIRVSEPDPDRRRTLAFTSDSSTIVTDFERYDRATGERLARLPQYTNGFRSFQFAPDSRSLITFGGTEIDTSGDTWRLWDVETGALIREEGLVLGGEILDTAPEGTRWLVLREDQNGRSLNIVDLFSDEAESYPLPREATGRIIPNRDWTRYIAATANQLRVFTFQGERLYFDAGSNIFSTNGTLGWIDERTVYIVAPTGTEIERPTYGVAVHPSGMPQCLVDALPDWERLLPMWEYLNYVSRSPTQLAARVCAWAERQQPASADAVFDWLTPTPGFEYRSARTPAPVIIPGVPACLTVVYQREAVIYADLWRSITADPALTPAQLAELEIMLCEGLISSLGEIRATPTVDPNSLTVATATPLPAAPQTTGGQQTANAVMVIDVFSGERQISSGFPSVTRITVLRVDFEGAARSDFFQQFRERPETIAVSPNGAWAATFTDQGFVQLFRVNPPYEQPNARVIPDPTRDPAVTPVRREGIIGLPPTNTPGPVFVGELLPTLTPGVTTTPFPLSSAEPVGLPQWGQVEDVCPARQLLTLADAPADFAPPGVLVVNPFERPDSRDFQYILNPRSGAIDISSTLPGCWENEDCLFSPRRTRVLRFQTGDAPLIVSRLDGSEPVFIMTRSDADYIGANFSWRDEDTLEYQYNGWLPNESREEVRLFRLVDVTTGARTDPALVTSIVVDNLLPADLHAFQPDGTLAILSESTTDGTRQYLYDTATGERTYFARGSIDAFWRPIGRFLYYRIDGSVQRVYDAQTDQHAILGELPSGDWSRDGRYLIGNVFLPPEEAQERLLRRELLPRIQLWDSETGLLRRFCVPEIGTNNNFFDYLVSPDARYIAAVTQLALEGDTFPLPTPVIPLLETPYPTATPIPLEREYELRYPRLVILDMQSGYTVIVSTEINFINAWIAVGGES
jgi:WD40 repeat protein